MGRHIWASTLLMFVFITIGIGCGGSPKKSNTKSSALLRIECELPDAEVYLDSIYFREISEMRAGVRLSPGEYRVEVRHSDYHSRYFEFSLSAAERKVLSVELAPKLP